MVTDTSIPRLRGRIAELGIRHADIAKAMGMHETQFSAIVRGRREPPSDFDQRAHAFLDTWEAAERAADEARARVLAEMEEA